MTILGKRIFIILCIGFFFTLTLPTMAMQEIDMSAVVWDYEEPFIYDNTVKEVKLKNVPKELKVSYTNNSHIEIGSYEASAIFDYDENSYILKNYEASRYKNFMWRIRIGEYDYKNIIFNDATFVENGKPHSIIASNVPEGVTVSYDGNGKVEPGVYEVTASFKGNPYYLPINDMVAIMTIRRRAIKTADGMAGITCEDYGFDYRTVLVFNELDIANYADADLSVAGSYREIRSAFSLSIELEGQKKPFLNHNLEVEILLPKSKSNSDLEIYEYKNGRIAIVETSRLFDYLIFNTKNLSDVYLVLGTRDTYTSDEVWKALLILSMVALFILSALIIRRLYKRDKMRGGK